MLPSGECANFDYEKQFGVMRGRISAISNTIAIKTIIIPRSTQATMDVLYLICGVAAMTCRYWGEKTMEPFLLNTKYKMHALMSVPKGNANKPMPDKMPVGILVHDLSEQSPLATQN